MQFTDSAFKSALINVDIDTNGNGEISNEKAKQ